MLVHIHMEYSNKFTKIFKPVRTPYQGLATAHQFQE